MSVESQAKDCNNCR